jgi:hypothetical protein
MAKPKRTSRRPGATASHRPPAKPSGTRAGNGTDQGPNPKTVPNPKAVPNDNRVTSKATGGAAVSARSSSPVAAGATKAAGSTATRQRVQARSSQRRYQRRRPRWSDPMPILFLSVGGVLLIVGIFIWIAHSQNSTTASHGVPAASVLNAVEHPNSAVFTQVGAGTSSANLFVPLPNKSGTGLPAQGGKPVLMYIGGEYCPFCAADRWSLIMALSRFGTLSGIETNSSMTTDIYPGTPTFTFVKATYTSPYLVFDPKEIYGSTQTTPLQSMTSAESAVFATYDVPPYDSTQEGIPFIDFAGLYMTSGGSYDVGVLHSNPTDQNSQALTYAQIVSGLSNARNPIAQGIVGTANEYTAAICKMTNNSDKAVCSSGTISQIESQLPSK